MRTSVSFSDGDGGGIRVVNQEIGNPKDKCHKDLILLNEALTAGGAVLTDDQDLALEESAVQLGRVSEGAKEPSRRRIRRQIGTQAPVCVEK